MPQTAQENDLLLEAFNDAVGGRVPHLEENRVKDFGGADKLVALGSVDGSVRANAQGVGLGLDQLNVVETEATLDT